MLVVFLSLVCFLPSNLHSQLVYLSTYLCTDDFTTMALLLVPFFSLWEILCGKSLRTRDVNLFWNFFIFLSLLAEIDFLSCCFCTIFRKSVYSCSLSISLLWGKFSIGAYNGFPTRENLKFSLGLLMTNGKLFIFHVTKEMIITYKCKET